MQRHWLIYWMGIGLLGFAVAANAAVTTYTDESVFLGQIDNAVAENFESSAWDTVRSTSGTINAADTVTSLGITWRASDQITTSTGAGRSGYGVYSYVHGTPDAIMGHAETTLFALGFWVVTNTPFAKINLILDNTEVIDFNDVSVGTEFVFLGVVSDTGFTTFEIREIEGTVGDPKFIFMDDVSLSGSSAVINQPPQADAGMDQTVNEGGLVMLDGTGSVDLDDGIRAYQWNQDGTAHLVTLSDAAGTMPSFTAPQVDQQGAALVFILTVTDNGGLQDSDQVVVNVLDVQETAPVNQPPVADAGVDQTADEGRLVILDGSGSNDPDDGVATMLWRQTAGATVALSDPADSMPTFQAPEVDAAGDVLVFELTVEDNGGLVATDRISVTINDVPDTTGNVPTDGGTDGGGSGGGGGGGCFITSVGM